MITIREVHGEERIRIRRLIPTYAFEASPPLTSEEIIRSYNVEDSSSRYYTLFEDDQPLVTAGDDEMQHNVRGKIVTAGSVWNVASLPQARRKGYVRQMIKHVLTQNREKNMPISLLYPFRESFYQRLGYITITRQQLVKFSTAPLAPLLKHPFEGEIELIYLPDNPQIYTAFLTDLLQQIHGFGVFNASDEIFKTYGKQSWLALARFDGEVQGVMLYRIADKAFRATRFLFKTSAAKYLMLEWIARHIDQTEEAEIRLAPYEIPQTWLADLKVTPQYVNQPMGRVVDVMQLQGIPAGEGAFTAQIIDSLLPWNNDVFHFESVDGQLQIQPAKEAEFELHIQGLTALLYGAHDVSDFVFRGWGHPSAIVRQMFPPAIPFVNEVF